MVSPAKPVGFEKSPELVYLEIEVERISGLEGTVTSLMEQLESISDECAELHSELFTTRAQVSSVPIITVLLTITTVLRLTVIFVYR